MALSGPCMHQLQWWRATAPDPLVGVRACILEGPGDTWETQTPKGGKFRDSIHLCWAPLLEGHVTLPVPFPSGR